MNRVKNITILTILIAFLLMVAKIPVTCIFKSVTGISCPACGMTRSFLAILHFHFFESIYQNILGIPLFLFLVVSVIILLYEIVKNQFHYIPKVLHFFEKYYMIILLLLGLSFVINNFKYS